MSNLWVGATTPTTAWVRGKVSSSASVRLVVSESSNLSSPAYFGPVAPTSELVASVEATGLDPDTQYHFAFEHNSVVDTDWQGSFRTHPLLGEPGSHTVAMATCAGSVAGGFTASAVSNHPVFDVIRTHPLSPLLMIHGGDLHYRNITTNTPASFRAAYDDLLTFNGQGASARQGLLYRHMPIASTWDDQDFGGNDSHAGSPARPAAQQVYRERVPHFPLAHADAIYQAWGIGRTLYLMSDTRSFRSDYTDTDGPSKTMLGSDQKAWMESVLTAPGFDAQHLVWIMSSQWMGTSNDTWSYYATERDELVQMLGDTGWLPRMCQLSGDVHSLAIDSGTGNSWGNFPVYMFSSLDSTPSGTTNQYDSGPTKGGRGQYGTLQVHDNGRDLAVTGTGWIMQQPWRSHTSTLSRSTLARHDPPPASHVIAL
ncbi:alkaline phosphatase D family protein [Micromonospora gifhornensis]|uniref:alkaline phosphatase D family protein n=1 Tax=Micromonospora gifhornensis TaxID=84594 RepID=UPI003451FFB5